VDDTPKQESRPMKTIWKNMPMLNRMTLVFSLLGATAIGLAVVGAYASPSGGGRPATSGSHQLYLAPAKGTLTAGSEFRVAVRENSGTTAVNAVQANLAYPTDKFEFKAVESTDSAFAIAAQATDQAGVVKIGRGNTAAVTGDQPVATVVFTVKQSRGKAALGFSSGSALVESAGNTNILTSAGTASYRVK